MILAFIDFDGTITKKDTFIEFVRFFRGKYLFYLDFLLLLPILVFLKLKIIPNWRAKEIVFSYFFKEKKVEDILKVGLEFSEKVIPSFIRDEAMREIEFHKKNKTIIVVVSASSSLWIKGWCDSNQLELISTEFETKQGKLTGRIKGRNCYGPEKVNRIKEKFDLSAVDKIFAYGDSRSDIEMINIADVKYYKWERIN